MNEAMSEKGRQEKITTQQKRINLQSPKTALENDSCDEDEVGQDQDQEQEHGQEQEQDQK